MALTTANSGGGTSDSHDGDAKGEEEEEQDWDQSWKGYGVRDASWLEGPKEEMKEEDWGGGWKRSRGWQWGGKYEEWDNSTEWKTNRWDHGGDWYNQKQPKPPWAYKNEYYPHREGRYVKGGYEADGVRYE